METHLLERTFLETYNSLIEFDCDPYARELADVHIFFIDNTSLLVHAKGESSGGCDG